MNSLASREDRVPLGGGKRSLRILERLEGQLTHTGIRRLTAVGSRNTHALDVACNAWDLSDEGNVAGAPPPDGFITSDPRSRNPLGQALHHAARV